MPESKPSTFYNMLISLVLITLISSFSLGFVYDWTEEPIAAARLAKQMRAIDQVLGQYDNDVVGDAFMISTKQGNDSLQVFPGYLNSQQEGVAIRTYSDKGYTTRIWLLVGLSRENRIQGIEILDHKETPGLGSKMSRPKFKDQFMGMDPNLNDLKVTKDGGEIDAISGATITSRAVAEAVQLAYDSYMDYLKNEERTDN